MRARVLLAALMASSGVGALAAACGDSTSPGPAISDACADCTETGANAEAGSDARKTDARGDDASNDASNDAATSDVQATDAANDALPDAVGDVASPGDASVSGPTLLLSDTAGARIDLLTTAGAVLHTYATPVTNVVGVSHDRRLRNGFWAIGRDSTQTIYKVGWNGSSMGTVTNATWTGTQVRGLDHWVPRDAGADADILAFVHNSTVAVTSGVFAKDGVPAFQMGFYKGSFQSGFWGVSMLEVSFPANVFEGWFTRSGSVERWRTASQQATVAIQISDPRGLASMENGEFWVVDGANHQVVHLSATGSVLGSFTTPGTDPAGLSYDPGP